jgi:ribosomal protein L14
MNVKTKVNVVGKDIIAKVIGKNHKKRGNFRVGEVISMSIKKGKWADPASRPGKVCKAIITNTTFPCDSARSPAIKHIRHNKNTVLLLEDTKKTSAVPLTSIRTPIAQSAVDKLNQFNRAAKRTGQIKVPVL